MAMAGGSSSKKRRRNRKPNPAAQITDDLLVEILARVPYRSLCRFRCVSKHWRALISHPDNRARLPQTIAGIFYRMPFDLTAPPRYGFANVSGTGWPFIDSSFLPDCERERLVPVDCCNGLLLCRCYRFADRHEFNYLVLNPATKKWVAVPITRRWSNKVQMVRLGFDPTVSSHFHVFEFQLDDDDDGDAANNDDGDDNGNDNDDSDGDGDDDDGHVLGVKIYSSETGVWIHKQSGWGDRIILQIDFKSVFLDGVLYVIAIECVIGAVDVDGKTWRIFEFPRCNDSPFFDTSAGFIDLSQGRLHFANVDDMVRDKLAIWVLEDKDSEEWTLKHTVCFKHLVGKEYVKFGFHEFIVVAIHPDRNMVFFVFGHEKTLMSYDMDSGKVCFIGDLGHNENEHFLPYVPLFSKSLPDGGNQ